MNFKRLLIAVSAAAGILAVPVRAEINFLRLYMVGAATPAGWNENLPEEMVAIGNDRFLWEGWLYEGDFKFLNTRGDWGSSIVATQDNQRFDSGSSYKLNDNTGWGSHNDFKFYNDRAGMVRVIVDLRNLTATFRRPALGLVGDAARGWALDRIIPVFTDDEGRISWTGQLRTGELKILADGAADWFPAFNAPFAGDVLSPGSHLMKYRTSDTDADGNFVDFKYNVPRAGLYTLTFAFGSDDTIEVSTAAEPDLTGAFGAPAGRYVIGVDRGARRLHIGPVPSRLYIGTSGTSCIELKSSAPGVFSSTVELRRGEYYKLAADPDNWEATAFSPVTDTDITSPTAGVAPLHGYSYTVPSDGLYAVTADFSGSAPSLSASVTTGTGSLTATAVRVAAEGRDIVVSGHTGPISVCDIAGKTVGTTARTTVGPGIYIVTVDGTTVKILVK